MRTRFVVALLIAGCAAVDKPANGASPYITISISDVSACALYTGPCNTLPTLTETSTTTPLLAPPTQSETAPPGHGTSASVSMTGTVSYNQVTWSGSTSASEPPTPGLPVGQPNYEANATAQMSATAVDALVVTATPQANGTLLPNGSPVQGVITLTTKGSYECAGGWMPNELGEVAIQVTLSNNTFQWTPLDQHCGALSLSSQQQFTFSTTVGQSIPLQFSVETSFSAYSANQDAGSASWDPPGGGMNIDSMTAGATFVSQSGTNYSTPSQTSDGPLPLWALGALGAGLVGIASRRMKKAN